MCLARYVSVTRVSQPEEFCLTLEGQGENLQHSDDPVPKLLFVHSVKSVKTAAAKTL